MLLIPIGNVYPHYILYVLVFLVPFTELLKFSDQMGSVLIILGGLVFVLWWSKSATRELEFQAVPGLRSLLLFGVITTITTLFGTQPINLRPLLTVIQLWMLAFLVTQLIRDPNMAFGLGASIVLSATLVALTTLFGYIGFSGFGLLMNEAQMRARSFAGGINPTSALINSGIAFAATYIKYERGVKRSFIVIYLVVLWLGNLATVSIAGIAIGAVVTAIALSGVFSKTRVTVWLKLVFALSFVIVALIVFDDHLIEDRLLPRINIIATQDPIYWFSTRGNTWSSALQVVAENPVFGTGIGYSPYFIIEKSALPLELSVLGAHNLFLTIAAESGLPTLCVFLFLFIGSFVRVRRNLHMFQRSNSFGKSQLVQPVRLVATAEAVMVALFGTLVYGLALDSQSKFMWVTLGLSMAVGNMLSSEIYTPRHLFDAEQGDARTRIIS